MTRIAIRMHQVVHQVVHRVVHRRKGNVLYLLIFNNKYMYFTNHMFRRPLTVKVKDIVMVIKQTISDRYDQLSRN